MLRNWADPISRAAIDGAWAYDQLATAPTGSFIVIELNSGKGRRSVRSISRAAFNRWARQVRAGKAPGRLPSAEDDSHSRSRFASFLRGMADAFDHGGRK